jgi:hypothetical protein
MNGVEIKIETKIDVYGIIESFEVSASHAMMKLSLKGMKEIVLIRTSAQIEIQLKSAATDNRTWNWMQITGTDEIVEGIKCTKQKGSNFVLLTIPL